MRHLAAKVGWLQSPRKSCALPRRLLAVLACSLVFAAPASPETHIWVDANGITQFTDDPDGIPPGVDSTAISDMDATDLGGLWDSVVGPPLNAHPQARGGDDRTSRIVRGAAEDIEREAEDGARV